MGTKKKKPLIKGGETGSVKEAKKAAKSRGGNRFIQRIPADGIGIRFLTEPDHWFKYWEHYDETLEGDRNVPCTEDCDYCNEGVRSSKRFLVNALHLEDNKVIPLVLPASLANDLLKKYDKFHTLMDRDYELSKEGTGLETEYDLVYESPKKMKLDRYDLLDLGDVLAGVLAGAEEDDDEDDEPKKGKKSKGGSAKGKSKKPKDDDDDLDEDDDDEDERPAKKRTAKKTVAKKRTASKPVGKTMKKRK